MISLMWNLGKKKKTETTKNPEIKFTDIENRLVVPQARDGRWVKMGEGSQNIQTSNYKINYGSVIYSMVTIFNYTLLYI